MDLEVTPALTIPARELGWRFSRSSGPGGQHVNTSDSRVELTWSVVASEALAEDQRARILARLANRLVDGALTVAASEQRSQLRNRDSARDKLREVVAQALAPDAPPRRPTKPSRRAKQRRLDAKGRRAAVKRSRQRPAAE